MVLGAGVFGLSLYTKTFELSGACVLVLALLFCEVCAQIAFADGVFPTRNLYIAHINIPLGDDGSRAMSWCLIGVYIMALVFLGAYLIN
jgi:hypothetical protein